MLCYCYDIFHVLCHKGPGVLQVIKVTALIRAILTKIRIEKRISMKSFKELNDV